MHFVCFRRQTNGCFRRTQEKIFKQARELVCQEKAQTASGLFPAGAGAKELGSSVCKWSKSLELELNHSIRQNENPHENRLSSFSPAYQSGVWEEAFFTASSNGFPFSQGGFQGRGGRGPSKQGRVCLCRNLKYGVCGMSSNSLSALGYVI